MERKNKDNLVVFIILLNLFILLSSIYLSGVEDGKFFVHRFEENGEKLLSDTERNINIFQFVVEKGKFPVVGQVEPNMPAHPPLYYFLLSPLVSYGNENSRSVSWLLQIASIVIFFIASIVFWRTLKRIEKYFRNSNFTVYAIALFCFLPSTLGASRMITPDVLFFLFFVIALYFLVRVIQDKETIHAVLLGIVLGLAFWTWLSTIPLLIALGGFIFILGLFNKRKERNLLLLSFLIGVVSGIYSLIRNLLVYGSDLIGNAAYSSGAMHQGTNFFVVVSRIFKAYWGGVYGGVDGLKIIITALIVVLILVLLYGIKKSFKESHAVKSILGFGAIFSLVLVLLGIHHNCNLINLLLERGCVGWGTQFRYLIPLNPIIGIFVANGLVNLEKKKEWFKFVNYIFIFGISALFVIEFLVAFS